MKTCWIYLLYAIISSGCAIILGAIGAALNYEVAASVFVGAWFICFGTLCLNAGSAEAGRRYDDRIRKWHELEEEQK